MGGGRHRPCRRRPCRTPVGRPTIQSVSRYSRGFYGTPAADRSCYASQRPPDTQRRYEKLMRVESQSTAEEDFTLLVSGACAIFEEEMQTLLLKPAAVLGDRLVAAVAAKDRARADMLARW